MIHHLQEIQINHRHSRHRCLPRSFGFIQSMQLLRGPVTASWQDSGEDKVNARISGTKAMMVFHDGSHAGLLVNLNDGYL